MKKLLKNYCFLAGIIIILLGAIIFLLFYEVTESNNVALILGFVGFLSTFIVIGNYSQVQEIKHDFNEKTEKNEIVFSEKIQDVQSFNTGMIFLSLIGISKNLGYNDNSLDFAFSALRNFLDMKYEKDIDYVNQTSKIIIDIIENNSIRITTKQKIMYLSILNNSGLSNLINLINAIETKE